MFIRGDFVVGDATLNRFFALHVIAVPLILVALVAAHLIALHEVGSNNPDGVEIKKTRIRSPHSAGWHSVPPVLHRQGCAGVVVFLIVFSAVVFLVPEMGGYFLSIRTSTRLTC